MKVPPRDRGRKAPPASPSGDQLIRDYLTRVAQAGLRLPKGARMAFVGRTRARIERECGTAGLRDPDRVMEVLAALGEPEELVRAERARIDAAWVKRRASTREEGEAPAAITAPRDPRRLHSRWRPASDTQPLPHLPPSRQAAGPSPDPPTGPIPLVAEPSRTPVPEITLASTARLARGHLLETTAIGLLAVGGVLFPILPPAWLLGSLLAVLSRIWDIRDKVLALVGPFLITVIVSAMIAVMNRVPGNFVVIYFHAFADGAGYLLRFGCLACATYLAWRVHRGPRVRVPPWQRQPAGLRRR